MNYLFYIVIFISVIGLLFLPPLFWYRLKSDFFSKQALKQLVSKKCVFFSSYVIQKAIKVSLKHRQNLVLDYLLNNKIMAATRLIKPINEELSVLLKAFDKPLQAISFFEKKLKKRHQNDEFSVWLALLLEATENPARATIAWDNIRLPHKLCPYLRAHYFSHLAQIALKNGDLAFASRQFYKAVKLFNRSNAFYEEGETYLKLGTIYRISFIDDMAETLFLSALKIFTSLCFEKGIAKAYAYLGMLMTGEERFNEAEEYLNKSLQIYNTLKYELESAEILNQLALLFLLQKDYKKAQSFIKDAQKKHSLLKNQEGIAFSLDLLANCYWKQKDLANTIKFAAKAADIYEKCTNISGFLDSLYLQAQALFESDNSTESETVLRKIIAIGKKDSGCFYLANAYNLLGIIYVKRKDLSRAKGLFQQSLDLEQRGVRSKALAADYTNLGLVEIFRGHEDEAKKNLQTALGFACEIEDDDLCEQIRKHLNKLSN